MRLPLRRGSTDAESTENSTTCQQAEALSELQHRLIVEYENPAESLPGYYDNMGAPLSPPTSFLDQWRLRRVAREVAGESVLEVGCYRGDFLRLLKATHEIRGTDVNEATRQAAIEFIGAGDVVAVDFRNGWLRTFADASVDTVVCMEVLEHLADDRRGLSELLRVARRRVVVTVPYRERLLAHLCTHCGKPTPNYGHLRSYDEATFPAYLDALGAAPREFRQEPIGSKYLVRLARWTGGRGLATLDRWLSRLRPDRCQWLVAVIDK